MKDNTGKGSGNFKFIDFFIIILFLSIAVYSINLFRLDLLHTINLANVEPVGTVVIKKNTVQRRHSDRVLWDRLAYESPVYIGDVIRVAEISAATLHLQGNSMDLEENTLIRIMLSPDGEGIQVILTEGTLSVAAGKEGTALNLDLNGRQVQVSPGAVISAAVREDGRMSVQVNEGSARFMEEGRGQRDLSSGTAISLNADGVERPERTVVVRQPAPNARYLKGSEPFIVRFSWNRINLASDELLRLEISADRNFSQIASRYDNLDRTALARIDAGFWYWRISYENTVLANGSLTVTGGSELELYSPAANSLFRYEEELPNINFRWMEAESAVSYKIEVSSSSDFSAPQIQKQVSSALLSDSSLAEGTWYWRVMPVFPSVFEGETEFSKAAFFRIEKTSRQAAAAANLSGWLREETSSFTELPPDVPMDLVPPELVPPPPDPTVTLSSPAQGAQIDGLTALRQQTAFRWSADGEFVGSRFILSRNANPLQGQPARQIQNPGRTVQIDSLTEGNWYWTVEITAESGNVVRAPARRLQVLPIPLLPPPSNLRPANGTTYGHEQLRTRTTIDFNWSAVRGANAYVFTLYQQTASAGRRQIFSTTINSGTSYTLQSLRVLDRGTFVWQVEAVNARRNVIEQRGRAAESAFTLNFNAPRPVQIEDTGILYGN